MPQDYKRTVNAEVSAEEAYRKITRVSGTTAITMTHAGLTPAVECFDACETGWNFYVGESLLKLLTDDQGLPDQRTRKANT